MSIHLKSKQLRELYPDVLGIVVLPDPSNITSGGDTSYHASTVESLSTGLSMNSSSRLSSETTDGSEEQETTRGKRNLFPR